MRTRFALALLPLLATGCVTLTGIIEQPEPERTVKLASSDDPKPEIYIERYDYQPPGATQIQIGRYSTADAVNTDQQENLLNVVIDTEIPSTAKTVGDGIEFLLLRSGFSMAKPEVQGKHVQQLLEKPLPHAHRGIGPVMLKDALMMLVGKAYWMKVDPVHRLIAFDTVEEFK